MNFNKRSAARAAALLLVSARLAHASDGTIDLNLDPAATTTISNPGSYVVVNNVTMTANVTAVSITASNVTLDLNGHTITGTGLVAGDGISGAGANVVIKHGTVVGFYTYGIASTGANWTVRNVTVSGCGLWGLRISGPSSTVEDCQAIGNNTRGNSGGIMMGGTRGAVRRCVANDNDTAVASTYCYGIYSSSGHMTIEDNVADGNDATGTCYGIYAANVGVRAVGNQCSSNTGGLDVTGLVVTGRGGEIANNTCKGNVGTTLCYGINGGSGNRISENTVLDNSSTGAGSTTAGIAVNYNCKIIGNVCCNNIGGANGSGIGIQAGLHRNQIEDNVCNENTASGTNFSGYGINSGGAYQMIKNNQCGSNTGGGTGRAHGIYVTNVGSRIEGNLCAASTGTTALNYGIYVSAAGGDCAVVLNTTNGNGTGGIFLTGGNYRAGNLHTDGVTGGTAGTVPGGADTAY